MIQKYSKEITQFFVLFLIMAVGIVAYLWNQPLLFPGLIERLFIVMFFSALLAILVNLEKVLKFLKIKQKTSQKKLSEKVFNLSFLGFFGVLIASLFWIVSIEILLLLSAIVIFFGIISRLF